MYLSRMENEVSLETNGTKSLAYNVLTAGLLPRLAKLAHSQLNISQYSLHAQIVRGYILSIRYKVLATYRY